MNNEFIISRIKKQLNNYCTQLDEISEEFEVATYDRKEELVVLIDNMRSEIESEKDRVNKNLISDTSVESTNYLPALEEAIGYLNQALDPESNQKVTGCLYDASSSLMYYLSNVKT